MSKPFVPSTKYHKLLIPKNKKSNVKMIESSEFLVRAMNIARDAKILLMPEIESKGQWLKANILGILSIANIPHKNPLKDLFPSEMAGINKHDRNNSQPINIILLFNNLSMVVEPDA